MKILALDLGDRWIGAAISDVMGITSRPYKTVEIEELDSFIEKTISDENIKTIVIGYPKTLKGKESEQTLKVIGTKEELEKKFTQIEWILWDERLSSKRANVITQSRGKGKDHSIAAAFILQSYLDYISFNSMNQDF